jgi:hypothetical protein
MNVVSQQHAGAIRAEVGLDVGGRFADGGCRAEASDETGE